LKRVYIALALYMPCVSIVADDLPQPELSGHVKTFLSVSDVSDSYRNLGVWNDDWLVDSVSSARLKADYEPWEGLDFRVHYEVRATWGDSVRIERLSQDATLTGDALMSALPISPQPRARFLDLESEIAEESNIVLQHGLDRLRVRMQSERVIFTVGRQAVSWGTGLFWNPTDLFTGFSPDEIDRDEKLGVDVVRLMVLPTFETSIDIICEPLGNDDPYAVTEADSSLAARITGHVGEYDFALLGGSIAADRVLGGDFSGYLKDAGFRGEWLYTWVDESDERDYFKGLLSLDYSFQYMWDPYVAVEYFYNGLGVSDEDDYVSRFANASVRRVFDRGTAFNIGQQYIGVLLRVSPSTLWSCNAQTVWNALDHSAREYVYVTWSVAENVEVLFAANIGLGPLGTEFAGWSEDQVGVEFELSDLYFTYLKWYL